MHTPIIIIYIYMYVYIFKNVYGILKYNSILLLIKKH